MPPSQYPSMNLATKLYPNTSITPRRCGVHASMCAMPHRDICDILCPRLITEPEIPSSGPTCKIALAFFDLTGAFLNPSGIVRKQSGWCNTMFKSQSMKHISGRDDLEVPDYPPEQSSYFSAIHQVVVDFSQPFEETEISKAHNFQQL